MNKFIKKKITVLLDPVIYRIVQNMPRKNGRGSSVGIATDCGMDGPGIESRCDEIFRLSRPALGPIQHLVQ